MYSRSRASARCPSCFPSHCKLIVLYYLYIHVETYTYAKDTLNTCFFLYEGIERRDIVPLYIIIIIIINNFRALARVTLSSARDPVAIAEKSRNRRKTSLFRSPATVVSSLGPVAFFDANTRISLQRTDSSTSLSSARREFHNALNCIK